MKLKAAVSIIMILILTITFSVALAVPNVFQNEFWTDDDWFIPCNVFLKANHEVYDNPDPDGFHAPCTSSFFDEEVVITGYCYVRGNNIVETYVSSSDTTVIIPSWPKSADDLFLWIGKNGYWIRNSDLRIEVFTGDSHRGFPTDKSLREIFN